MPIGLRCGLSSFVEPGEGDAEFEGDGDKEGVGEVACAMAVVEARLCEIIVDWVIFTGWDLIATGKEPCDIPVVVMMSSKSLFKSGSFQIIGLRTCVATWEKKLFNAELGCDDKEWLLLACVTRWVLGLGVVFVLWVV